MGDWLAHILAMLLADRIDLLRRVPRAPIWRCRWWMVRWSAPPAKGQDWRLHTRAITTRVGAGLPIWC